MKMIRCAFLLSLLVAWLASWASPSARDSVVTYSESRPLVYEDVWDLWPYAFLNDQGEPEGYNIDLIRMMMSELHIPYVIRLKASEDAFNDLKAGRSDLMLGLAVGYHDEYGLYGKNAVTLFTQSVVTPKSKPVEIKTFRDLGKPGMKVIVNHTSMCYHLMKDYGWEENAIPEKDIREVIQRVSAREEGQIVWNTLTLKWLMQRYLIDNLQLTPVNMPHGEYKFMSNNQRLLDLLDEKLTELNAADKLKPLQDKWFYPEHQEHHLPRWVWWLTGVAVLLLLVLTVYVVSYRLQSSRLRGQANSRNRRLALILETSKVRIWTYDIAANQFAWRNENGQVAYTYTMEEFAQRYSPADFAKLKAALDHLAQAQKQGEEEAITLDLRVKDVEGGDTELRDYSIVLSVLARDRQQRPTVIIGTKKDVTDERQRQRQAAEREQRFWAMFNNSMVGVMYFDRDGRLADINAKACELLDCRRDDAVGSGMAIADLLGLGSVRLEQLDGHRQTADIDLSSAPGGLKGGRAQCEFHLRTVCDDNGLPMGLFAVCRDVACKAANEAQEREGDARVEAARGVLRDYEDNIDRVLKGSDMRMAVYSPQSHTLTLYSGTNEVDHALTQTRCMTLVADRSKKPAMRLLNDMDARADRTIDATISTTLRIKGGLMLELHFHLVPVYDKEGRLAEYFGLCRNISQLRSIEAHMAEETAKVQEVENTKNSFVKNMVQEIYTPMDSVAKYAAQLDEDKPTHDEEHLREGILDNAYYLLHLIDNILLLSRLEAHMVEIMRQPCDFAEIFEVQCAEGWGRYKNAGTRYVVENPYEQLVVDIDAENLGMAIRQVTANAAQHTRSGAVRARCDFIGRRLTISVDDTGDGIDPEELERLNELNTNTTHNSKGLGLAICKELLTQMGGTLEISSEKGLGTTVYMTLHCHATVIKRKKLA